jgi:hypothetical protein
MKKSELRQIIREELTRINEDVFVLWADRVNDNLPKAIKAAKYKGKGGTWSKEYKTNAASGYGTVFFVEADNVDDAKQKVLTATDANKTDKNIYNIK